MNVMDEVSQQQQQLSLMPPVEKPVDQSGDTGKEYTSKTALLYAQVYVHLETKALDQRLFTYGIPEHLLDDAKIGTVVSVPFGRQPSVTGIIVDTTSEKPEFNKIRLVSDVLDPMPLFNTEYFSFLRFVSDYYATPLHQVIQCALPAPLFQAPKKRVALSESGKLLLQSQGVNLSPMARRVIQYLQNKHNNVSTNYLSSQLKLSNNELSAVLAMLNKAGLIDITVETSATIQPKTIRVVSLNKKFDEEFAKLTKRQEEIVTYLKGQAGKLPLNEVADTLKTTPATLKKMADAGVIDISEVEQFRNEAGLFDDDQQQGQLVLNEEQQTALETILNAQNDSQPHLLYGVTGSGKTEVYLKLAEKTLSEGKLVLVMVPEISLTSQIAQRFIRYFGQDKVCLWHSQLSAGERADTWRKMVTGEVPILIGARSAVWTPATNLGLIIIDEEHDNSYKQDSPVPRYDARHLSEERIKRFGGKMLLGSATPDVETYTRHLQTDTILTLKKRYAERPLAKVTVVDMKQERYEGNRSLISRTLLSALEENLHNGEQAIVLMNRRGFYTTVSCGYCQHIFQCPNCDVSVTVHKTSNTIQCHYCGYRDWVPDVCTQCASSTVITSGVGTQRVEEELTNKLPSARLLRLDSDVLKVRHAHRNIIETFKNHEADILIGTQMIAKGLDIPNVTLVGVLSADSTFALPDYKSSERGFQLLTQVAGRAGRGEKPGRVIVQAISPEHPVIEQASDQDYLTFYEEESKLRESLWFPPYSQLFRFIVSGESDKMAWQFTQAVSEHLKQGINEAGLIEEMTLAGPASCVIGRIQGRYRYHLLVKSKSGQIGHQLINDFFNQVKPPDGIHFLLDHDAQTLL